MYKNNMKTVILLVAIAIVSTAAVRPFGGAASYGTPVNHCRDPCPPYFALHPVCASNGVNYLSRCEFDCARNNNTSIIEVDCPDLRPAYNIPKVEFPEKPFKPPNIDLPNPSTFDSVDNLTPPDPSIPMYLPNIESPVYTPPALIPAQIDIPTIDNPLVVQPPSQGYRPICACDKSYLPVCGSDGTTYNNICELNCKAISNPGIHQVDDTFCASCACPYDYNPQCGSDGNTYSNECALVCAKKKNPKLQLAHKGECKDICRCPRNYKPVCGSDGKTYNNECLLRCAIKKNPDIVFYHKGKCDNKNNTNY